MVAAQSAYSTLSTAVGARGMMTRSTVPPHLKLPACADLFNDGNFFIALQAVLEVLPADTAFSAVVSPEPETTSKRWKTLRRLAFSDRVEEPKQLELWNTKLQWRRVWKMVDMVDPIDTLYSCHL